MNRRILGLALGLAVASWACNGSEGASADGGQNAPDSAVEDSDWDGVLDEAGSLFDLDFVSDEVIDTPPTQVGESTESDETRDDGSRWRCSRQTVSDENADESYFTFNPNAEVIWPGNLLQGATLTRATPEYIVVDRGPLDISVNLLNGSDTLGVSSYVENPTISNVADAINTILQNNTGITPASFTYNAVSVSSQEEMAAELGVSFNTLTTAFKSQLSFASDVSLSRVLVTFQQQMYTMAVTPPTSVAAFFADDVSAADLAPFVGPGNPPAYISSVTYGRRFYALIESHVAHYELEASVHGSYDGAVTDGSLDANVDYVSDLAGTTIKVFSLGGSASGIPEAITGNSLQELNQLLTDQDGELFYTAVPLSYVVRDIRTHQLVYVKSANSYDIVECTPLDVSDENVLFQFVAEDLTAPGQTVLPAAASPENIVGYNALGLGVWGTGTAQEPGLAGLVERWEGRRGTVATYVQGKERPVLIEGDTPSGKAAVGLLAIDLPEMGAGWILQDMPPLDMELEFSAAALESSDYTLIAVARVDQLLELRQLGVTTSFTLGFKNVSQLNLPNGLFYGTTLGANTMGQNLLFGPRTKIFGLPQIYVEHSGLWPDAEAVGPTGTGVGLMGPHAFFDVYQVLSVVYRRPVEDDPGTLEIWQNGLRVAVMEPPAAVSSISGARMGAAFDPLFKSIGAFIRIAEFRAYDIALNELQLQGVIAALRADHGI